MNSVLDRPDTPSSVDAANTLRSEESLPVTAEQNDRHRKVLIVEDEAELAMLLEHYLKNRGFVTAIAGDGLTACRMINSLRPDLILLDIKLPELDGWEICRLVRKIPDRELASTPIMMLTALATNQDRAQGFKMGADDYMTKPYSLKDIVLRANKLIDRYKPATQKEHNQPDRRKQPKL